MPFGQSRKSCIHKEGDEKLIEILGVEPDWTHYRGKDKKTAKLKLYWSDVTLGGGSLTQPLSMESIYTNWQVPTPSKEEDDVDQEATEAESHSTASRFEEMMNTNANSTRVKNFVDTQDSKTGKEKDDKDLAK